MKKLMSPRTSPSRSTRNWALRLSQETLKVLTSDQLAQAVSGCLSTSWTTQQSDGGSSAC